MQVPWIKINDVTQACAALLPNEQCFPAFIQYSSNVITKRTVRYRTLAPFTLVTEITKANLQGYEASHT